MSSPKNKKTCDTILDAIGNTPMVKLNNVVKGVKATVYAKVETFNPGNSIKDRMAVKMIEDAEKAGLLKRAVEAQQTKNGPFGTDGGVFVDELSDQRSDRLGDLTAARNLLPRQR